MCTGRALSRSKAFRSPPPRRVFSGRRRGCSVRRRGSASTPTRSCATGASRPARSPNCTARARSPRLSDLAQVGEERQDLPGKVLDLAGALLVGADEIENEMAHAGLVESADALGDLLGAAERGIALGGAAEIHRITVAQGGGRRVERLVVADIEPREQ